MSPLWLCGAAWAQGTAATPPEEVAFARSRDAERDGRWAEAVEACREVVALRPEGPRAETCRRSLDWWGRRQDADGSFGSWTVLEEARRGRGTEARVAALDTEAVPETVRAEAALWRAQRALARGDAAAARALTAPWTERAPEERLLALARSLDAQALAWLDAGAPAAGTPAAGVWWARRTRVVDRVALGACAAFALGSAPLAAKGWARRARPHGLWILAAASGASWVLAEGWERGAGRPIPWMAAGMALVHVLTVAAWGRVERPVARTLLRLGAAVASAAVAWLALSWGDGLQAFGVPQ